MKFHRVAVATACLTLPALAPAADKRVPWGHVAIRDD